VSKRASHQCEKIWLECVIALYQFLKWSLFIKGGEKERRTRMPGSECERGEGEKFGATWPRQQMIGRVTNIIALTETRVPDNMLSAMKYTIAAHLPVSNIHKGRERKPERWLMRRMSVRGTVLGKIL
jgi:hypothetical protein